MEGIIRNLKEAIGAGYGAEIGLDYRWQALNRGARRMPEDDMSMDSLERRSAVVAQARRDMQAILDTLIEELEMKEE